MKHLKTKTKFLTQLLAVVVISLSCFVGCKSNDKDIDQLNTDMATMKTELTTQINGVKTELENTVNTAVTDLTNQINQLKSDLETLEAKAATKEELEAAKKEILEKTVSLEAFNAYKKKTDAEIKVMQDDIAKAATKEELQALKDELNGKIVEVTKTVTNLGTRVTTLEGTVGTMSGQISKLQQDLTSLKSDLETRLGILESVLKIKDKESEVINDIYGKLDAQLKRIEANEQGIKDLVDSVKAINTRIDALTARVEKNEDDIKQLRKEVDVLNKNMKVIAKAIKLNFQALSNRLTGLTFVADYYVNGIAAMNFSPLVSDCKTITPEVKIKYHLSPSFITKEDIEVDNMSFIVKKDTKQLLRLGAPAAQNEVKATFVQITDDGDLEVSVTVDDLDALFSEASSKLVGKLSVEETFPSVLLQVPLSEKAVRENEIELDKDGNMAIVNGKEYPENRVIRASHYVRLDYNKLKAQEDVYLALDNKPDYTPLVQNLKMAMTLRVDGIDGATITDPTVVTLPYEGTIDLVDTVTAILAANNSEFDVERYGLKYKFDLLDESGKTFEYDRNSVDQQKFVKILDSQKGTVTAAELENLQALIAQSKGRTPIIRVWMYNDAEPNCPVLYGFIKLAFEEQPDIDLDYTFEASVAECDTVNLTIPGFWTLDSIYKQVGVDEYGHFVDLYRAVEVVTPAAELVGQISEVWDETGAVPGTTLANVKSLKWAISAQEVWTWFNNNPDKDKYTVTVKVKYSAIEGYVNPDFVITLTKTFTRPVDEAKQNITEAELLAKYWYDMNGKNNGKVFDEVKHNVYVPGTPESSPTNCIFNSDLSAAFKQDPDKGLKGYEHNYQYYFKDEQPTHPDGTKLTVSDDGQILYSAGMQEVAYINPFATNVGDLLILNRDNAKAKELLNAKSENLRARLGLRYDYCPDLIDVTGAKIPTSMPVAIVGKESFDVVFVRPIEADGTSAKPFIDAKRPGEEGTYMEIRELVNLKDWRGAKFSTTDNLYGYYDIQTITVNIDSIYTNLNGDSVVLKNYPSLKVAYAASVVGVTPSAEHGYLTYENNGNVIGTDFELYVPVTITYYWGEIKSTMVTVPVKKTIGPSGVKRK